MNKTSIVILTYNNLDYNIQCIESIKQYTNKNTYEIVIVDNGSTDGTREWLKQQDGLKLVFPKENTGFPKGCNLGIDAAAIENDILLLNNDIVVTPNWLDNLNNCLYSDDSIGAVGPITNYAWNNQAINVSYSSIQEMIKFSAAINISDKNKWEQKAKLVGFCLLIKRSVLNLTGLLDEQFSPGNFEDDDLCARIIKAGYKLFLCNDCFIHHYGNISFKKEPGKFNNILAINSQKFRQKWGFDASLTEQIDSDLISLINADKDKDMNILQVGCSRGTTLLRIKYLFPNTQIFGLEGNRNLYEITSNTVSLSSKDIEDFPLDFNENFFDYILLGDYITYSKNPWNILKELKKYLKPDGYIITTVPNAIHYSVIRDLLKGSFLYMQNNYINNLHSKFFTYNDIIKIAEECGYKAPYVLYWYNNRNDEDENFLNALCSIAGEDKKWNFVCYKYIARFQNTREVPSL